MTDRTRKDSNLPAFPYGAVYFRVSNPPREEWERDYKTAREDSNNIFRHWFLWSAVEREPGRFTWDDYDRQLDLAASNGMKTIVAEMSVVAPEWVARLYPHALYEKVSGVRPGPYMQVSCATGGVEVCLDNSDVRERATEFLTRLVERYRNHDGLGGYDIWNECNLADDVCYCGGTVDRFREWARAKYGSIEVVREAWRRPSMADWSDVVPSRRLQPYADTLDWLEFRIENAHRLMEWRRDLIASFDPNHRITAHGVAMTLRRNASGAADDWLAASLVESYGVTWGSARHGDEPWKQPQAMDLIRAASRGKPWWHAEAYGGPLWFASNVVGRTRDSGRICYPEDIRYWNLTSYMHGATGTLFLRWRPLLDGPLVGAFGPYGMDGGRTDRSRMSTEVARWAQAEEQQELWKSRPVQGEVGILVIPESQRLLYALAHDVTPFTQSVEGAWRGFHDLGYQPDFVRIEDIDRYRVLYLPCPLMMTRTIADRLAAWVSAGGALVSEGCPAWWGDGAHAGVRQPNLGLDKLFGAHETYIEFAADLLGDLELTVLGSNTRGGYALQAYETASGTAVGWYRDGRVAAVEHTYGAGRTLLVGTMPGIGYSAHDGDRCRPYFEAVARFFHLLPHATRSDDRIRVRVHDGEGGLFLWIANPTRQPIPAVVTISERWSFTAARPLRGPVADIDGPTLRLTVPARDVAVARLQQGARDAE